MSGKGRPQRKILMPLQRHCWRNREVTSIRTLLRFNDEKLTAIHAQLASLTASLGSIRSEVDSLKTTVENNSSVLDSHGHAFEKLEMKLADMEDRNQRCNICVIGLKEGLEGSNVIQYLSRSLPNWFSQLADVQISIMKAHRIYSDRPEPKTNVTTNRTLIFNVFRYTTRQAILQAAWKSPLIIDGWKDQGKESKIEHSPPLRTLRTEFPFIHPNTSA